MTRSWRDIHFVRHSDGCNRIFTPLSHHRWCFICFCHSANDYLFVAFLKTPSNNTGYTASSEVARKRWMDINTELESGFEIHMGKTRKITDTFPCFSVTTSKMTRESPLPQSAWLLWDRQGGGVANFWDVRPSVLLAFRTSWTNLNMLIATSSKTSITVA